MNVVLGHVDLRRYATDRFFMGALIGRVAGRIGGATFHIDGRRYDLAANDGHHHLHGGPQGFHARDWAVLGYDCGALPAVTLGLTSPAGESGYPGRLDVTARFAIEEDGLTVELVGRTDATTPVCLTTHPYFNLSGDHARTIDGHVLTIPATAILELDPQLIPTGAELAVDGTPFDFRRPALLRRPQPTAHPQIALAGGYDHSFILPAARACDAQLSHPDTGLTLSVSSNQPSIQCYTGQHLVPSGGAPWQSGCGVCLEPQHLPNAVNEPRFVSPLLRPGERYHNRMRFQFHAAP